VWAMMGAGAARLRPGSVGAEHLAEEHPKVTAGMKSGPATRDGGQRQRIGSMTPSVRTSAL